MVKESSAVTGYLIPAFLGVAIAIVVGLYIPQLTVNASESNLGLAANMEVAFADTSRRLGRLLQADFRDTAAWGVPVFGIVIGCFFRFITQEDS